MKRVITLWFLLVLPLAGQTADQASGITALSPELRQLFAREMTQLQAGMQDIMIAYVSGDWDTIASIATQMQQSYVLKQNLTDEQRHELHTKLAARFQELDQSFHYFAGMLSHVAEKQKVELIGFYYAKMSETCVSCHRAYATQKFPFFDKTIPRHEHQH